MIKLKPDHIFIEVVKGVEGPSLMIGNERGGHRLAGPKPWGGGQTIHQFQVDIAELVRVANEYKQNQKHSDKER